MEPFKKRDRFLSCDVLNQLGNPPADANVVDHINTAAEDLLGNPPDDTLIEAEEDAPAVRLGNPPADLLADHPDASFDDQGNASNVIEAEKNALNLSIRHNGDETKVTEHEAGGAAVNDRKLANESKELIVEGNAHEGAFVAVIGDGIQPDETKVIEHAGGGGGEHTDKLIEVTGNAGGGDGEHTDKQNEVIGNAGGDAAGGAIGDAEHTDKPEEVIERAGGGAPDAVGDGEQTDITKKVIENNEQEQVVDMEDVTFIIDGGSSGNVVDGACNVVDGACNEQEQVVKMVDVTFIIDGGSSGNALDVMDDGKQMHVVDGACNVGGGDLTIRTGQGAQIEGKQQAAFLVPDGNDAAVAPGGGISPMDDGIQNEQTHTYCMKRKSQEPGEFSHDAGDSGHDAPGPKRTKHDDAGGDEIGTRRSSITPPVAGNRTLRLFGVNISPDVQENPVMHQPRRNLRLFGVNIITPKDQE